MKKHLGLLLMALSVFVGPHSLAAEAERWIVSRLPISSLEEECRVVARGLQVTDELSKTVIRLRAVQFDGKESLLIFCSFDGIDSTPLLWGRNVSAATVSGVTIRGGNITAVSGGGVSIKQFNDHVSIGGAVPKDAPFYGVFSVPFGTLADVVGGMLQDVPADVFWPAYRSNFVIEVDQSLAASEQLRKLDYGGATGVRVVRGEGSLTNGVGVANGGLAATAPGDFGTASSIADLSGRGSGKVAAGSSTVQNAAQSADDRGQRASTLIPVAASGQPRDGEDRRAEGGVGLAGKLAGFAEKIGVWYWVLLPAALLAAAWLLYSRRRSRREKPNSCVTELLVGKMTTMTEKTTGKSMFWWRLVVFGCSLLACFFTVWLVSVDRFNTLSAVLDGPVGTLCGAVPVGGDSHGILRNVARGFVGLPTGETSGASVLAFQSAVVQQRVVANLLLFAFVLWLAALWEKGIWRVVRDFALLYSIALLAQVVALARLFHTPAPRGL